MNPYEGEAWDQSHSYHYDPEGKVDRHAAIRLERCGRFSRRRAPTQRGGPQGR